MVWKNWTSDLGAKTLCFVIAVGLWFYATDQLPLEKERVFPIRYENVPPGLTPLEKLPEEVKANVTARGRFLGLRQRDAFCQVDLSGSSVGPNTIHLSPNQLRGLSDRVVTKENLEPASIQVEFDETVIREIPIAPTIVGAPADRHLQVGKPLVDPTTASVKGPRRRVDEMETIATEEIDIDGDKSTVRKRVRLERPSTETIEITPMTVEIGITIEPELTSTLDVALEIGEQLSEDWTAVFQPGSFQVEITGAKSIVESATKEVSSILLQAKSFSLGTSILRFKEVRGREIVYARYETFPLVTAPPWGAGTEPPLIGPSGPPGQKIPPAVQGEVVGSLPLPREIEVLHVEPERFVLKVRTKSNDPALVRAPDLSP